MLTTNRLNLNNMTTYVITVVMKGPRRPIGPNDGSQKGRKSFRFSDCRDVDDALNKLERELITIRDVKDYWIEYIFQDRPAVIMVGNADAI